MVPGVGVGHAGQVGLQVGDGGLLLRDQPRQQVVQGDDVDRRERRSGTAPRWPRPACRCWQVAAQARRSPVCSASASALSLASAGRSAGPTHSGTLADVLQQRPALPADDVLQHVPRRRVDHVTGPLRRGLRAAFGPAAGRRRLGRIGRWPTAARRLGLRANAHALALATARGFQATPRPITTPPAAPRTRRRRPAPAAAPARRPSTSSSGFSRIITFSTLM